MLKSKTSVRIVNDCQTHIDYIDHNGHKLNYFWNRKLTDYELKSVLENPWQFFAKKSRWERFKNWFTIETCIFLMMCIVFDGLAIASFFYGHK